MATSSKTFSGSTNAKYQTLYLVFNRVSQDVANNRTLFSYEAYIQGTSGGSGSTTAGSYSITGATTTSASGQSWSWTSTKKQTIATGSFYVSHNSDGTLGTQTLNVSANVVTTSGTLTASTSVSLSVPTIPRASQPTLNYSTRALGSAITISTNRASTSFTHTLTYAFGNQSGTIGMEKGVGASQSWTLPASLASAIPNATSGTGTITCKTYNGDTLIGSKSVPFTATVPNNTTFQPTASISSIVENGYVPSGITVYVQNKSKVKVTSSGTGKYSSTIKNYSVSVAGIGTYLGSDITSDFLKNSGTVRVTLTVTDSRGLKGSTFQDITVVAYSPPQLPTFNAQRSQSTPTNIYANFSASISPVSNQNNKYLRIRSKASDGGWVLETESAQSYTFSGTQTIVTDPDKSYTIEIYVADKWTSITQTVQVGTAFTLIDFNASGKGMAIGKVSEIDGFEVALPAIFNQGIKSPYGRIVSADLPVVGDNTVKNFLVTSTMTTGRPQADGFITHYEWDNTGGWSAQLYIPNNDSSGKSLQFRTMVSGVWTAWRTIWNSENRPIKYQHNVTVTQGDDNILTFSFIDSSDTAYTSMNLVGAALSLTAHVNKLNALSATGIVVRTGGNRFISGVYSTGALAYIYATSTGAMAISNIAGWTSAVIKDYVQSV